MGGEAADIATTNNLGRRRGVRGVFYVAYGPLARAAAERSIASLRKHNKIEVMVVGDGAVGNTKPTTFGDPGWGARWAKLNMDLLTPWEQTLYLDADTVVHNDVSPGFAMLEDGWDVVIAPSSRQGGDAMGHLPLAERESTLKALGGWPVALQAGVMFFRKSLAVAALFAVWRAEWRRFKQQDQGALLRALHQKPVRLWLLGKDWNMPMGQAEALIEHQFGRAAA